MGIYDYISHTLGELERLVNSLTDEQYVATCPVLSGGTVGQHTRHIIELFQCLMAGYNHGIVNYENRKRDTLIQEHRQFAIRLLQEIAVTAMRADRDLTIASELFDPVGNMPLTSNYHRELAYTLEHTIHHMALIKPALLAMEGVVVPNDFGVAPSTLKYRETCAQ
jgi:uncharacterized damage-inducible protein DinB